MKPITYILLGLLVISNHGFGQGKLEKAEKSLSKKQGQSRTKSSYTYNNDYPFLDLLLGIAEISIYAYDIIIETPYEAENSPSSHASITKYPYLDANIGNYAYDRGENTTLFRSTITNRYIVQNQKLYGNHFNADMRFLSRIGLEVDYLQLWEENTNFGNNTLAIFTAMAKYHRVRTEQFNVWWGLGATYVGGEVDEFGFVYGIGAEVFFVKPFSIESNFYGSIINQRSVNKITALLNYHHKRYKFSGGYEHLKIGSLDLSTFSTGVGVSF